jgi:(2R)-sulfolactate sulfo-lyase subunit alpha
VHKFLIHKAGNHVGVATSDIGAGERVVGVYMDDDSTVEVEARGDVPLGHKIAVEDHEAGGDVTEHLARTANGRLTSAEALGHREFTMTKLYRSA